MDKTYVESKSKAEQNIVFNINVLKENSRLTEENRLLFEKVEALQKELRDTSTIRNFSPKKFISALEKVISDMPVGSSGYCVPWAIVVIRGSGDMYVNGKYTISGYGGTTTVKVSRISLEGRSHVVDFGKMPDNDYGSFSYVSSIAEAAGHFFGGNQRDFIKVGNIKDRMTPKYNGK